MLIKSNNSGLTMVPLINAEGRPVAGGFNNHSQVRLFPGWNEVTEEQWKLMEPHMIKGIELEKYELRAKPEEVEDADGNKKVTYPNLDLVDVRADIAKKLVAETWAIDTLKKWSEDYKLSTEVRAVADAQLAKLDKDGE